MSLTKCIRSVRTLPSDIAELRARAKELGSESAALEAFIMDLEIDLEGLRVQLAAQGFDVMVPEEAPAETTLQQAAAPAKTEPLLTEKQFRRLYSQHIDLRNRGKPEALEVRETVMRDGWKPGANVNTQPIWRSSDTSITGVMWKPMKGDVVYLPRTKDLRETGNGGAIRAGWKPKAYEAVVIEYDGQNLYEAYKKAFEAETTTLNQAVTETPAFKQWFGQSKAVDENGQPLVVYHGTDKDISAFDPAMRGSSTGVESARQAFWFSASPDNAGEFASLASRRRDGNPNIMPVFLSLQNPLEVDASVDLSFSETITKAKAAGHDGVIFRNAQDTTRNPNLKIGDEIYSIDHRGMFMSESLPEFLAGETTVEAIQKELDEAASYFAEEAETDPDMVDEAREWAEIRDAWAKDPSQFSIDYGPSADVFAVFEPTQIKSAIGNDGTFSPTNPSILRQEARGFIQFGPAKDKFKITLTGKANLSTFLHESGHFFLEVLQDQVMRGEASPQQVKDFEAIRAWMGLQPGEVIGVKHHELFARGFELYLAEGKAPSAELTGAFQSFKAWLLFVYKRLAGLNVNLSDDIRQVMDRLVASDQAIAEARVQIGLGGQPMAQDSMGLTDAEYATYVESWMKARDQQSMDADARVLRDAARAVSEAWKTEFNKVVEELTAEVDKTRGAMARKAIEEGEIRLHKEMVPQDMRRMARGLMDDTGLDLDAMAEMLNMGFTSGEQMLQTIAGSDQLRRDVKARARAIMAERHGEMTPATLAAEAMKAVHNKPTGEILLTEYRALASKAGIKTQKNTMAMLKAAAEAKVAGLTKRQLEPAKWRRAELKAANESGRLAGQGKAQEAAIAKRQQLMAAAMYKATVDAQDRIEAIKDKLTDIQKTKKWAVLGKAGQMYQDGVDQILEAIEFKNVSAKALRKRETLPDIIKEAEANGEAIAIPDYVLGTGLKNYSQMTLEELEAVHDAVMNLWTLAKLKNTLRDRKDKRDRDEIAAEVEKNVEQFLGYMPEKDHRNPSFWEKTKAKARSYSAFFSKVEFMVGWLDGQPSGGVLHRFLYQPLADARHREFKMLKEKYSQINAVMDAMPKAQKVRWNTKRQFMGKTMTGRNIIAAVLNMGTESNYRKLLEGLGWNAVQFEAEVNAFMTKEDWAAVTNIWEVTGSLWPEFEQVVRRATGIVPPKLEGRVIQTPFGEIEGAYYPVVYDPVLDARQADNQAKKQAERFFDDGVSMAKVIASASNKRTEYTGPIKLELDVLTAHIAEQVHYITHYDAVTQAWKLVSHPKVRAAITKSMGAEFYSEFKPYLQSIAQNAKRSDKTDILSEGVDHLRVGSTILSMGYNLVTALKQPLGALTVLDAIGPKYWAIGVKRAWFDPNIAERWRFAWHNSQEIEILVKDFDVALRDLGDVLDLKMDKGTFDKFKKSAFEHIGMLQLITNVAAWHGAYAEAEAKQMSHDDAVRYADSVVRKTQSAASLKDTSQAQRKNALTKAITMYGSFMNVLFNRMQDIWRTTRRPRDVPRALMRIATLLLVPSLALVAATEAVQWAFGDEDDEDENDSFLGKVMMETAGTFVGSFPGVNMLIDVRGYGTDFTPIQRSVKEIGRAQGAIFDWVTEGETPTLSEVKAIMKAITVVTKVPVYGPYREIERMFGEEIFTGEE